MRKSKTMSSGREDIVVACAGEVGWGCGCDECFVVVVVVVS